MTATPDPLSTIDTPTLRRMVDRAYRDAARSWQEYRDADRVWTHGPDTVRAMLRASAESADAYHAHLRDALAQRED